jgi:ureidoacrylate peracid hydrolase
MSQGSTARHRADIGEGESLIFAGIDTMMCVHGTLSHAFHLGYYPVLAQDICASVKSEWHEFAVNLIGIKFGLVTTSNEIMQIWDKAK